ncbi:DNA-directed RNA polymerase III subunit RPC7-like isoform X2 [Cebidichthys violaceus]|uniref:DNA-directed RNA polymerase III subunit RPC7-like isoform X2 n=1 Tax=Cebidichthys violaceus TaxID=271503 RepID=UPI0035CA5747
MAGRAGGRGRRMMSFSVEAVGINRGDSLPPSIQQPTPLFPVMEQKPLPLTGGEEAEYLLALKQEFRGAMKTLPFYIQPAAARRDVERYSDKYHSNEQTDGLTDWNPGVSAAVSHSDTLQSGQKKKKKKVKEKEEVLLKLETLQKKEEQQSSEEEEEGEEKKKKQEEEEAEGEEEYDEEEFEEETDYIMSYFDNGEEFGGDSDENMDEAIY